MPHLQLVPVPPFSFDDEPARTFGCVLTHSDPDAAWIAVSGDLDLATVAQLHQALRDALSTARVVTVDLRRLTHIDSTGLNLIADADAYARRGARRLVFVRGPAHIDRLCGLVGLYDQINIVDLPIGPEAVQVATVGARYRWNGGPVPGDQPG